VFGVLVILGVVFQSTLPVGGATCKFFSVGLPVGEFQSTLPVGGATPAPGDVLFRQQISIHAPRGGSDSDTTVCLQKPDDFNPRSPWGERH